MCVYDVQAVHAHTHTLTTRGTNMKAQQKQCATTYQTLTAKPVFMADSTVSVMELIAAGHTVAGPHDARGQALCGMARVTGIKITLTNTGSCKYTRQHCTHGDAITDHPQIQKAPPMRHLIRIHEHLITLMHSYVHMRLTHIIIVFSLSLSLSRTNTCTNADTRPHKHRHAAPVNRNDAVLGDRTHASGKVKSHLHSARRKTTCANIISDKTVAEESRSRILVEPRLPSAVLQGKAQLVRVTHSYKAHLT